jgi:hypothetical protein
LSRRRDALTDVITGAGPCRGPHVRGSRDTDLAPLQSLVPFDPGILGGVAVG